MRPTPYFLAAFLSSSLLAASSASAMDSFFVGARGQGMAGSLTAATDDVDAQYYNPAAFAFFGQEAPNDNNNLREKHFGLGVDAGVGVRVHGALYQYADRLSEESGLADYSRRPRRLWGCLAT